MIEAVRSAIRTRVPEVAADGGPAVLQIGGTNWRGGRVHFAVLGPRGAPLVYARVMRNLADDGRLAREHEILVRLASDVDFAAHVPAPLFAERLEGRFVLCERAAAGRPMRTHKMRAGRGRRGVSRFSRDLVTAASVAIRLAGSTEELCNAERFDRDVLEPLRRFWREAGGHKRDVEGVLEEVHAAFGGRPRTCVVHGDFIAKNLLVDGRGGCVAVDWETVEPAGLPLIDLFYFITRYAYVGGLGRGRKLDAVRAFYAKPSHAAEHARAALDAYCSALDLPAALLAPVYRLHFLYKARLKALTTSLDNPVTRAWVEMFVEQVRNRRGPFEARSRWGVSSTPRERRA
jgi:aminoglycoside phosphotransferase (APT) family kinase protein